MVDGAFDGHKTDSTSSESDLIVFRSSSRLLLGDDPGQVLTNLALSAVRPAEDEEFTATFRWGIPSPGARAGRGRYGDGAAQSRRVGVATSSARWVPSPKPELYVHAAFGDFTRFQLRLIGSAGRVIKNGVTRAAEELATTALVGRHGDFVIRSSPRSPNDVVAYAQMYMKRQSEHLRVDFLEREVAKASPPPPATWSDLRPPLLRFGRRRAAAEGILHTSACHDARIPSARRHRTASERFVLAP